MTISVKKLKLAKEESHGNCLKALGILQGGLVDNLITGPNTNEYKYKDGSAVSVTDEDYRLESMALDTNGHCLMRATFYRS